MPLTYKSFQISPEVNIWMAAFITKEGALMNMGLISCSVFPTSSQMVKKMTTDIVPRIFLSWLR